MIGHYGHNNPLSCSKAAFPTQNACSKIVEDLSVCGAINTTLFVGDRDAYLMYITYLFARFSEESGFSILYVIPNCNSNFTP